MRSDILYVALTGAELIQTGTVSAQHALLGVPNVMIAHGIAYNGIGRGTRSAE